MQYLITLSEKSGRLLRQLCDSGRNRYNDAVSREDFLSAFVEEQLGELFVRRERPKAGETTPQRFQRGATKMPTVAAVFARNVTPSEIRGARITA